MASYRSIEAGNFAPYEESAFRAILRNAAAGIGTGFGAGLSAVPRGANFGTAFLASAGAASKAAQDYALKQQQLKEDRQHQQFQENYMQALTKQAEKPPAQPKETYGNAPWYMRPEYRDTPEGKAARAKAEHIPTGAKAKPKSPMSTIKDSVSRRVKLGKELQALNKATPDELPTIMQDPSLEAETRSKAQIMLRKLTLPER